MQQTLILIKPDGVQRRLVGSIIERFEKKGLRLAGLKMVKPARDLAEKHYAVHKGKPCYDSLLQFLTSGPTVAMVWEGREAVVVARTLMGVTDGAKAVQLCLANDIRTAEALDSLRPVAGPDGALGPPPCAQDVAASRMVAPKTTIVLPSFMAGISGSYATTIDTPPAYWNNCGANSFR